MSNTSATFAQNNSLFLFYPTFCFKGNYQQHPPAYIITSTSSLTSCTVADVLMPQARQLDVKTQHLSPVFTVVIAEQLSYPAKPLFHSSSSGCKIARQRCKEPRMYRKKTGSFPGPLGSKRSNCNVYKQILLLEYVKLQD